MFVWASLGYAEEGDGVVVVTMHLIYDRWCFVFLGFTGLCRKGDGAVTWLVGKEALLDTEVLIYGGQLLCALSWVFISLKTF